ncbi:MAG TPA: RluA family pseudouridine synthase [Kofleriaceae bacterium]|nr:RluA family pseudouridine synthase [Kofleriaceae bacterium]
MQFIVGPGEEGRIDRLLTARYPGVGRRRWAELFAAGWVAINGARARKGDRVASGDQVTLRQAPAAGGSLAPVPEPDLPLDVLHVDARLLGLCKPAGQPSHPLRAGETGTLANALVARFPECAAVGRDPREGGLCHRLDRGTSGVVIAARDTDAYLAVRGAFARGEVDKRYLALVAGAATDGELDAALVQRGPRALLARPGDPAALPARTRWRLLASANGVSLVEVAAATGRMHQVRAHLAAAGHPLAGDPLYGGPDVVGGQAMDQPFLHARSIALPHPDGGRLVVEAPLPARRAETLVALGVPPDRAQ